jgi:NADH dehydrogenase
MQAPATPRHVVIVGGGFGGLCAAQKLAGVRGVQVTIIDRRNHHLFQPLLYQVATAALSPAEIAYPIRTIFSGKRNVRVLLDRAVAVDLGRRVLVTADTELPYDNLILACGARHSYFGHDEWEPFAPGLKSLEEATEIRRRMLTAFELAEKETDPARQRKLLTFVVIGGGPTGVELAGALGEISRFTLAKDFRNIDPRRTPRHPHRGGPRILSAFDESLAHRATTDLESLGVTVWTSTRVTRVDEEGVTLGTETVQAATILWAAGVAPSELNKSLGVPLDRQGRIIVEQDCSLKQHPEVFIVGDQAHFEQDGQVLPGLAPVAMQQGRLVGSNLRRELAGRPRTPFRYRDKGQMATIGRRRAHRRGRSLQVRRLLRLAHLAVRTHPLPHRLQESHRGAPQLGLELRRLQPRRPPDRRQGLASAQTRPPGSRSHRSPRPPRPGSHPPRARRPRRPHRHRHRRPCPCPCPLRSPERARSRASAPAFNCGRPRRSLMMIEPCPPNSST